ncbi:ATP-dependent RNA helicase RhlE [Planctomycetes bacterium Poly30]|uniref:ATP-dependent RNA helicase RhlE n=1 Tax=Saltatorellus ferox TaxID=2528018 RepID=A0A518EXF2_9BACT|nr:ATP-dependent RNA helicase RhlE [Planctomycetes bacterium Poly30]
MDPEPIDETAMPPAADVTFESFGLAPSVLAGVRAAGFDAPRPIQVSAIPPALLGRDILGLARTGTGKTAAFALPLLQRLVTHAPPAVEGGAADEAEVPPVSSIRALVLAPTRELAIQIGADIDKLGSTSGQAVALLIGGLKIERQREALRAGATIAVACTGRLMDLVREEALSLAGVEVLVLDEADRMVDMGFLPDVRRVLKLVPKERQTMMFSATMPEEIQALAQRILRAPEILDLGNAAPPDTIDHALLPVRSSAKTKLTLQILKGEEFRSAIIFVRTKQRGKVLTFQLEKRGISVTLLHGDKKQGARGRALDGFKSGEFQVLVATDLASRGLDVENVSHVINYDIPLDPDTYVHRIGRTGRAERKGIAFTLISRGDLEALRAIENNIGERIPRRFLEGFAELDDEYLIQKANTGKRVKPSEVKPEYGRGSGIKKGGAKGPKEKRKPRRRR